MLRDLFAPPPLRFPAHDSWLIRVVPWLHATAEWRALRLEHVAAQALLRRQAPALGRIAFGQGLVRALSSTDSEPFGVQHGSPTKSAQVQVPKVSTYCATATGTTRESLMTSRSPASNLDKYPGTNAGPLILKYIAVGRDFSRSSWHYKYLGR